jgi:cytoskeleton protein RodZ
MADEENAQQPSQGMVGEQLRKARERAGLTVSDIAHSQHLRPAIIQAIENGDYRQIDSELFLKGYIRAYASQVSLVADPLITQLNKELEPLRREREQAQATNPLQDIERKKARKKRTARIVLILILVGILGYGAVRILDSRYGGSVPWADQPNAAGDQPETEDDVPAAIESTVPEPEAEPAASSETTGDDTRSQEPELNETASDIEPEVDPAPAVAQPPLQPVPPYEGDPPMAEVAPEVETVEAAEPTVDSPLPAGSSATGIEQSDVPGPLSEPVSTEQVAEPDVAEPDVAEPGRDVSFFASFSAACWVQVTNADGRTIISSLYREGDTLELEAEPPLRVVLGAANAVSRLEFSGEIIDLSAYRIVNNRVEFTLDI